MNRPQIDALTGLRGVAALWVMFFHFIKLEGVGGIVVGPAVVWQGHLGVDMFFVLSGFVLMYVYGAEFAERWDMRAYAKHLWLRLGRVYPLHLATLLALVCGVLAMRAVGMEPRNAGNFAWADILPNLLLVHAWFGDAYLSWNFVSWSISAEWFAYLLLLPLYARILHRGAPLLWIAAAVAVAVLFDFTLARDPATGEHLLPYHNALWRITVEFFAGAALFKAWQRWRPSAIAADVLAVVAALGLMASAVHLQTAGALVVPAIMLLVYALASSGVWSKALLGNRAMLYLGEISYSIYMIHPMVLILSNLVVRRWLGPTDVSTAMIILVVDSVLAVALAAFAYHTIEVPFRNGARRWLNRPRPVPAAAAASLNEETR